MTIGGSPDPIDDAEWPTDLEEIRQQFAGALNVYRTMAHHPQLLAAWAPLRRHVVKENTLPPRLQELVVLRTAYHAGSRYEWSHHVARGLAAGLSIKEIEAVGWLDPAADLDETERAIIDCVDSLQRQHRLSPELRARVSQHLSVRQVMDLMALVGFYHVLAYIIETFETPLDRGIDSHRAAGWSGHD